MDSVNNKDTINENLEKSWAILSAQKVPVPLTSLVTSRSNFRTFTVAVVEGCDQAI